jgi:outer membrane protein assembly factor BamB
MAATQNQPSEGASGLESHLQAVGLSPTGAGPAKSGTPNPAVVRPLAATTWIAALFCLLVCAAMLYQHQIAAQHDPWKSPQLLALKAKLIESPKDENLKTEIRRLDLEFRQRYFRRLTLNSTAAWLLIGGVAAMLFASKRAAKLHERLPMPRINPDAAAQALRKSAQARQSVAVVAAVVVVALGTLVLTARSPLPASSAELDKLLGRASVVESAADVPSIADFRANWPRFRGADGGGAFSSTNGLPLTWDDKTGANILWKSPVPALGFNSPVVWSNRVFISGGDAQKREVFCFDAADGKVLWRRAIENVPGSPAKQPEINEQPGFAAATMATDGRRVYVFFANGDLAALTMDGAPAWSKNLGVPKNPYGHAASLAMWPGKLIVQMDQGESDAPASKLYAFDSASGRALWERSRPVPASWATPIIVESAGGVQIVTVGQPWVISYALADGNELWRAELLDGEITSSPVLATGGLVIAVSPNAKLIAIRSDGAGDVTKSHVVWTNEVQVPDVTSPTSNGELVFTVTSGGVVVCCDAKDGKLVWQHELDMEVQASPAITGDRLFLVNTKGDSLVLAVAREFKELGWGKLDDQFFASPAFANGRIFLRGSANLWCLVAKEGTQP